MSCSWIVPRSFCSVGFRTVCPWWISSSSTVSSTSCVYGSRPCTRSCSCQLAHLTTTTRAAYGEAFEEYRADQLFVQLGESVDAFQLSLQQRELYVISSIDSIPWTGWLTSWTAWYTLTTSSKVAIPRWNFFDNRWKSGILLSTSSY